MYTLNNLIPLSCKITVYVPATVNVDVEIDNSVYVERVAKLLSNAFGGATASKVKGYWVADNGDLVTENTVAIYSYCTTKQAEMYLDSVVELCYRLKIEMKQEAIALEYNGNMYFI